MSKFFLVLRILVLLALLLLLASAFWGIANRKSSITRPNGSEHYEEFQRAMPAPFTSILLITLVVAGILATLGSIFLEYHRHRRGTP